ncbi:MAG: 2-succinyl-5-enolpyruvyl-6-hydroxy-3-cyclohexene-1-carboxylic-acid synthase, partial [Candidatus Omnitrophica bacterium]|nr:2-succinyl-5-enolpyruvyl-6-hydroxy-3-cyclohexene-1-carboxylic-acid synthase [Candidatus Omnitrophota bacterium]
MKEIIHSPNINILWAQLIVEELIRQGVDYFHIAPGSRSAPLAIAVAGNPRAKTLVHYDERGLGFHALGYTSATGKPAAIITTSGTAVANLFPAVIETFKKKLPLIILTADRPPELRYTGANQTIDQVGIFGKYVRFQLDLCCPTSEISPESILTTIDQLVHQSQANPPGPVHLNCMFREPLAPMKQKGFSAGYFRNLKKWLSSNEPYTRYVRTVGKFISHENRNVVSVLEEIKNGIIVVGKIKKEESAAVLRLAKRLNWPVFPDITSSLRLGNSSSHVIPYFAQIIAHPKFKKGAQIDGVLHLGGRITTRRWYDWVEEHRPQHYITVLNHPLRNDPSHVVNLRVQSPTGEFCQAVTGQLKSRKAQKFLKHCQNLSQRAGQSIDQFLAKQSFLTEPQVVQAVSDLIPENSGLFLGNSLPIREMDLFAHSNGNDVIVGANRGASGI